MPLEACWFGTQPNFRNITRTRQPFCSAHNPFSWISHAFGGLLVRHSIWFPEYHPYQTALLFGTRGLFWIFTCIFQAYMLSIKWFRRRFAWNDLPGQIQGEIFRYDGSDRQERTSGFLSGKKHKLQILIIWKQYANLLKTMQRYIERKPQKCSL